jgi:hypothetical protein
VDAFRRKRASDECIPPEIISSIRWADHSPNPVQPKGCLGRTHFGKPFGRGVLRPAAKPDCRLAYRVRPFSDLGSRKASTTVSPLVDQHGRFGHFLLHASSNSSYAGLINVAYRIIHPTTAAAPLSREKPFSEQCGFVPLLVQRRGLGGPRVIASAPLTMTEASAFTSCQFPTYPEKGARGKELSDCRRTSNLVQAVQYAAGSFSRGRGDMAGSWHETTGLNRTRR